MNAGKKCIFKSKFVKYKIKNLNAVSANYIIMMINFDLELLLKFVEWVKKII